MAAHLLETPGITPDRSKQMGQVITRQVDHMSRLVEDLIDVSRVSRGLIRMERDRVDLHKVIQSAIEQVRPMITANGHTLNVTTAPGAEAITVVGDRTRLSNRAIFAVKV
jgi:signal transduction histidine kinase